MTSQSSREMKRIMPIGAEYELTDQEAADLAVYYLLSLVRPVWHGHDTDFPGIERPSDTITKDRREKFAQEHLIVRKLKMWFRQNNNSFIFTGTV